MTGHIALYYLFEKKKEYNWTQAVHLYYGSCYPRTHCICWMSDGCHLILEFKRCLDIREDWSLSRLWQEGTQSHFFGKYICDSLEGSPLGGHPGVVWAGRILEGGLCASHGALVNQTRNSWPATAVIQASWGIFFNFMKMNMVLRIPFRPGLPANCLYIYGKMGRPWQEATE